MTEIWGHRGASGDAPENTLRAFALAAAQGADGVELDVQLAADGECVVIHDETVDRTTDGHGAVKDLTAAALRRLDAGAGERIPLLSEVFELLAPSGLRVNVELKNSIAPYPGLEDTVLELVARHGYQDRVVFSSFNHLSVRKLVEAGAAATGLLYAEPLYDPLAYARRVGAGALHPYLGSLRFDVEAIAAAQGAGVDVNVWTVNAERELREAFAWGVHAVITNYPARALALRD